MTGLLSPAPIAHPGTSVRSGDNGEADPRQPVRAAIADNATSAFLLLDGEGVPVYVNRAFTRMTGFTLAEMTGRTAHETIHHTYPDGRPFPVEDCPIDGARAPQQRLQRYETRFVRRDCTFFPALCTVTPMDSPGLPAGTLIEIRDVTDEERAAAARRTMDERAAEARSTEDERAAQARRQEEERAAEARRQEEERATEARRAEGERAAETHRRAESAVHESERRLRQITESIPQVCYLSQADPVRLLYVSPAYERIWERPVEELYADPASFLRVVHPEDKPRVLDALKRQRRGQPTTELYRVLRSDGDVCWISHRAYPLIHPSGRVERIVGVAEDVTARVVADQEREQALAAERATRADVEDVNMIKTELLGRLTQELRARAAAAAAPAAAPAIVAPDHVAQVHAPDDRATPDEIPEPAEPDHAEPDHAAAKELLGLIDPMIAPLFQSKETSFVLRERDGHPAFRIDRDRLVQICLDLLSNGLRATPAGGSVWVWCDAGGGSIALQVRDEGAATAGNSAEAIFGCSFRPADS